MDAGDDPRSQINEFCQAYCKRPLTKEDIVYTTSKFGTDYQTIVKLNCLGGQEYAGSLRTVVREAEKEAAVQALAAYATEIAAMQAMEKDLTKRRKVTPAASPAEQADQKAKPEAGESPASTAKAKLSSLCTRIAKGLLQKGETVYKCMNVPGGYQATVQLSGLPGEWKDRVWAGHVCDDRQQAEHSAAEIALQQIMEDPQTTEEADKAQSGKGGCSGVWSHGGGGASGKACGKGCDKGCGKGCGKADSSGWDDSKGWPAAKGKGKGRGQDEGGKGWGGKGWGADWGVDWGPDWGMDTDWGMWGPPPWTWGPPQAWGGGGGGSGSGWKGGSSSSQQKVPRHRISDSPVLGEVLEWKGQFAWVKPLSQLEHEAARGHGGKVYVHRKDLSDGLDGLMVGQTVQFFVYEDGSGLGGEDVQVV